MKLHDFTKLLFFALNSRKEDQESYERFERKRTDKEDCAICIIEDLTPSLNMMSLLCIGVFEF